MYVVDIAALHPPDKIRAALRMPLHVLGHPSIQGRGCGGSLHSRTRPPPHPLTRIASVVNHHQSVRAEVHPPDPERAQNERIMHWPAQIVSHTCSVLHKPAPNRHDLHLRFKPGARRRSAETHRRAGLAPRRAQE
jgi:hypothetical protein